MEMSDNPTIKNPQAEMLQRIEHNFRYHAPKPGQTERYEALRAKAKVDMGDDHCAADAVLCKALLVLAAETPAHALVTQLLAAYDAIHPKWYV